MCTSHLTEIIPFDTYLIIWGQYPVFSFPSFLRAPYVEWLQPTGCWRVGGGTCIPIEIISAERASTSCDSRQPSNVQGAAFSLQDPQPSGQPPCSALSCYLALKPTLQYVL